MTFMARILKSENTFLYAVGPSKDTCRPLLFSKELFTLRSSMQQFKEGLCFPLSALQ